MNEITRILERVDPSWVVGNAALRDTTTTDLWRGLRGRVRRSATNTTPMVAVLALREPGSRAAAQQAGIYRCSADKSTVEGQSGLPRTRPSQFRSLIRDPTIFRSSFGSGV